MGNINSCQIHKYDHHLGNMWNCLLCDKMYLCTDFVLIPIGRYEGGNIIEEGETIGCITCSTQPMKFFTKTLDDTKTKYYVLPRDL